MKWVTPKTDWTADDYFNVADWDRIRGNLEFLHDFVCNFFSRFDIAPTATKTVKSWLYASDLNAIESNLEIINNLSVRIDIGETKTFVDNGHSIDYVELNRIERACLEIYEKSHEYINRYYFCDDEMYADESVGII